MSPGPLPHSVCGSENEASLPSGFDQPCLGGGYISKTQKGYITSRKDSVPLPAYYRLTIHHPVKLFMLVSLLGTITLGVHRVYRSRALLGACAYNSTGRKYAPISEMRLIKKYNNNDIPRIGSALQFEYSCFPPQRIENGRVSGRRLQR